MFKTGEKSDFERMLDHILGSAKAAALTTSAQVEHESAARGTLLSSGTPIIMERLTPDAGAALPDRWAHREILLAHRYSYPRIKRI